MFDLNNPIDQQEFAERIKKARRDKDLTQQELADKIGCIRVTVTQWEKGKSLPEYATLAKLCEVLSVDVGYLMGDYDEKTYTIHKVSELTNLSENTIKCISSLKHDKAIILDSIINNERFLKLLSAIQKKKDDAYKISQYVINKGGLTYLNQTGSELFTNPFDSYDEYCAIWDYQISKIFSKIIDDIKI